MRKIYIFILAFLILTTFSFTAAYAQSISLLPKYGLVKKNEEQLEADKKFLASMDEQYKGDRKKAAENSAIDGWDFLRQGKTNDAMRTFNQAWLLDNKNGLALWGMAAIQGNAGIMKDALKLFSEAERYLPDDINFAIDRSRTIGLAAWATKNETLFQDAFKRYKLIYKREPQNILNLQNWALILYYKANYAEAWKKIKLAEATPRGDELDQQFITMLQNKMQRPK
jgi:tetratricopeptide (TPR) repeat protein